MATTLQQHESTPDAYPALLSPYVLSEAAANLDAAFIWARIEAWTTTRWSPRSVTWVLEGPGEWVPPLSPAVLTLVERWVEPDWSVVVVRPSPLGGLVLDRGHYRVEATVGDDVALPAAVQAAFIRLAEFVAAQPTEAPGARSYSTTLGPISESWSRNPAVSAKAMEWSGAADLLRPYRRLR